MKNKQLGLAFLILVLIVFQLTLASADIGITDPTEPKQNGLPVDPKNEIIANMPITLEKGVIYNVKLTESSKPITIEANKKVQVFEATVTIKENENNYIPTAAPEGVVVPSNREPVKNQKINELTIEEKKDSTEIKFTLKDETEHNIRIEKTKEKIFFESNGITAETKEKIEITSNGITIEKNGNKKEIKLMPDTVKEKVSKIIDEMQKIELALEETMVYKTKGTKQGKLLAFIPVQMQINAEVNAETGEIKKIEKPWWSFLVV